MVSGQDLARRRTVKVSGQDAPLAPNRRRHPISRQDRDRDWEMYASQTMSWVAFTPS